MLNSSEWAVRWYNRQVLIIIRYIWVALICPYFILGLKEVKTDCNIPGKVVWQRMRKHSKHTCCSIVEVLLPLESSYIPNKWEVHRNLGGNMFPNSSRAQFYYSRVEHWAFNENDIFSSEHLITTILKSLTRQIYYYTWQEYGQCQ